MGLFDIFRKKKNNSSKVDPPTKEEIDFAEATKRIFGSSLEQFDFKLHRGELEKWFTTIIYRKDKLYIKISGSTHPRDYPNSYNVVLGEGDSEDFFQWDWNSIALWRLKKEIKPTEKAQDYSFPRPDKYDYSLTNAKQELLQYATEFLNGDLALFYETRKKQNQEREPYKIHSPDDKGNYRTTDEATSVEQKKKYS